ncbi:MAG: hypothetical protein OXE84_14320 [Rhodobacteraceae bacterium]|nr:hypothetical protein [Paracoccaceae bacterium]MCY4196115.1 hypothetical protein [Paracoccaceae bacterium]MCY4326329.1 hypothetical protein [Paracoccaceae bacterium]
MFVLQKENLQLFESVERKNLIRSYERLADCIEMGLSKGTSIIHLAVEEVTG